MGQLFVVIRHDLVYERVYEVGSDESVIGRDAEFVIGRDSECPIWLSDFHVSRRHAVIRQTPTKFFIRDLGSHNGTFVEDRR